MPNIGGPELLLVGAVFLLLFGAKKLPELGSALGETIKNLRESFADQDDDDDA